MGIQISEIIPKKEITLKDLKNKIVAVDAFNILYQFLTTIKQMDGSPLTDEQGNITSHISGLLYRNINLLQESIKPIYVFDGKPPELKTETRKKRRLIKEIAQQKYEKAKTENDIDSMKKYSSQTVRITDKIIKESKEILTALGIPVVQASGEGEAEAAFIAKTKKAYASVSQDYDSLLFGTPILIRNLTLAKKRKTSAGNYTNVVIEKIEFQNVLNKLQINHEQLICIGILIGTDYNIGGVKGIGQKRALEIVKKYEYPIKIFEHIEKSEKYILNFDWQIIFQEFTKTENYTNSEIKFPKPNKEKIKQILLSRNFSENRINSILQKLDKIEEDKKQKGLNDFW